MLQLTQEYLDLPEKVVRAMLRGRRVAASDRDDLVGVAQLALVEAARVYDPARVAGHVPGAYLVQRIRWHLIHHFHQERRHAVHGQPAGDLPDRRSPPTEVLAAARDLEEYLSGRVAASDWRIWKLVRVVGLSVPAAGRRVGLSTRKAEVVVKRVDRFVRRWRDPKGGPSDPSSPGWRSSYHLADHAARTLRATGKDDLRDALALAGIRIPAGVRITSRGRTPLRLGWPAVCSLAAQAMDLLTDGRPRTYRELGEALGLASGLDGLRRALVAAVARGWVVRDRRCGGRLSLTPRASQERLPVWTVEPVKGRRLRELLAAGYTVLP